MTSPAFCAILKPSGQRPAEKEYALKYLTIEGQTVRVQHKNIRNLYLYVYPQDGTVQVSAPVGTADGEIAQFVRKKQQWISEKLGGVFSAPKPVPLYAEGETVRFFGEALTLKPGQDGPTRREGEALILNVPPGAERELREKRLFDWYRQQLYEQIAARRDHWQKVTGVKAREWRVRNMKTRWGTCNVRDRRIWLNLQLIQYPPRCLDYVMVHELTHLIEPSHNPVFQAAMGRFMPQWREIKKELNRQ